MIFIISLDHQALDLVLEGADLVVEVGRLVGGDARQKLSMTFFETGFKGVKFHLSLPAGDNRTRDTTGSAVAVHG